MRSLIFLVLPLLSAAFPRNDHTRHKTPRNLPNLGLDLGVDLGLLLGYELTWHDEFNSESDNMPSPENWIVDQGTQYPGGAPYWGNNEKETYTNTPENVHITPRDTLTITPLLKQDGEEGQEQQQWTSARIETQRDDFAATPGGKLFVEARIKTGCAPSAHQQGIWPAFWALGAEFRGNYTNWPMASEWDFMEVINGAPTVYSTLHCGTGPGGPCNEYNGLGNGGVAWSSGEWHWVGFEVDRSMCSDSSKEEDLEGWRDERLRWFVDGALVHEVSGDDVDDEEVWATIAHRGHFLLLDVAVGGNWPGAPNEETWDGEDVQLEVDFVRVWNSY